MCSYFQVCSNAIQEKDNCINKRRWQISWSLQSTLRALQENWPGLHCCFSNYVWNFHHRFLFRICLRKVIMASTAIDIICTHCRTVKWSEMSKENMNKRLYSLYIKAFWSVCRSGEMRLQNKSGRYRLRHHITVLQTAKKQCCLTEKVKKNEGNTRHKLHDFYFFTLSSSPKGIPRAVKREAIHSESSWG